MNNGINNDFRYPGDLARDRKTIDVIRLMSNPAGANAAFRHEIAEIGNAYRRNRVEITLRFEIAGAVGAGASIILRPFTYGSGRDGRGLLPLPKAAQVVATSAQVNDNIAAGFPHVYTVTVDGMDGLILDNQLDRVLTQVQVDFDIVATPVANVGT